MSSELKTRSLEECMADPEWMKWHEASHNWCWMCHSSEHVVEEEVVTTTEPRLPYNTYPPVTFSYMVWRCMTCKEKYADTEEGDYGGWLDAFQSRDYHIAYCKALLDQHGIVWEPRKDKRKRSKRISETK